MIQRVNQSMQDQMRLKRQREQEESAMEEEEEMGDFLEDDDTADWRQELKAITGYDPSKWADLAIITFSIASTTSPCRECFEVG